MRTPKFTSWMCMDTAYFVYRLCGITSNRSRTIWSEYFVLCIARLSKQPRAKYQCSRYDTSVNNGGIQILSRVLCQLHANFHLKFKRKAFLCYFSCNFCMANVCFDSISNTCQLLVFRFTRPSVGFWCFIHRKRCKAIATRAVALLTAPTPIR